MSEIKVGSLDEDARKSLEESLTYTNGGGIVTVGELILEADIKPNDFAQPCSPGNTVGMCVPQTQAMGAANTEPLISAETENEKSFLEAKKDSLDQSIDDWVERQGYSQVAMVTGAVGKALNEMFFPTDTTDVALSIVGGPVAKVGAKLGKKLGGWVKSRKSGKANDGCPQCL